MALSARTKDFVSALAALVLIAALAFATWLTLGAIGGDEAAVRRHLSELTRLPGLPSDAPVLAEAPVLPPADARTKNEAVAYYSGTIDPAPAFRFFGTPRDQTRAVECLALAAMAEAGPSDIGQRAVIQVILNRVRHPAFAKTVCGVVFEGSQRRTGCQFSFTCDGSLARRYGEASWVAARGRAIGALAGQVYAPVGNATHYHTDWVFPYWSPKLVKLARVETHLFFRWPGYWGGTSSLSAAYRGDEPDVWQPAPEGEVVASSAATEAPVELPSDTPAITGGSVTMRDPTGRANFVVIASGTDADAAKAIARALCKPDATCRVLGWSDRGQIPASFPIPPSARASLQFSFTRDPGGSEIVLYDCQRFTGIPREQCIPRARR